MITVTAAWLSCLHRAPIQKAGGCELKLCKIFFSLLSQLIPISSCHFREEPFLSLTAFNFCIFFSFSYTRPGNIRCHLLDLRNKYWTSLNNYQWWKWGQLNFAPRRDRPGGQTPVPRAAPIHVPPTTQYWARGKLCKYLKKMDKNHQKWILL